MFLGGREKVHWEQMGSTRTLPFCAEWSTPYSTIRLKQNVCKTSQTKYISREICSTI